jgi:polysaccharide export outer membrane protein
MLGLGLLGGCSHGGASRLPVGATAYGVIPEKVASTETALIRPGDRLFITVLGEPELTSDQYRVDAAGTLQLPLVGPVQAAGLTQAELRDTIRRQLAASYIRDPQVSISTVSRSPSVFAVEGEVEEPGVFEAEPGTTLLSAIAQAKSPTRVARLDEVVVFRELNGQRMGARFDLQAIRDGEAADPQILAGDRIVVGYSQLKGIWREIREAAPVLNLFYILN